MGFVHRIICRPLTMVFVCLLSVAGCGKKNINPTNGMGFFANNAEYSYGNTTPGSKQDFAITVGDRVFFSLDSSVIEADAQRILVRQAEWLLLYPHHTIMIEGHADDRGTREYNLALGQRRAIAVRDYLVSLGVSPQRMKTMSYGKERPVAVCDDISCWNQNRRVVISITSGRGA
ncbi:peptidoglycan-associated lipoprotein [Bartonella bacilliformis Peru38]|uniref:peptidoglycan-associated lipoprotein Pal n=1 Tax=Bartonella bacilliformis TaxID=774 RepID=UPI0004A03737|nr:peptidoglycan-associated lipoprotein Pal [Bartonella bacilliformis]KEG17922.1 peptidoglycan-associated lipoprotein [Bartonella bacilliformis Cond044]KEG21532.1 peptidoglycan-associated lipoprotein [Bartonella bacilliformis Peru38]KZM38117.1 peptidoglycan-associated lipoprotein [Bartonella bacilliformis]